MERMAKVSVHQPTGNQSEEIQDLYRLFLLEKAPALIGPNQESIPLPEPIYNVLLQVIGYMRQGKGVSVVPVMQELTTQQAANMLGASRPFVVDLLKQGKIEYHTTGTHRRVYLKDLLAFKHTRDQERRSILDRLSRQAVEDGEYDTVYVPEQGE